MPPYQSFLSGSNLVAFWDNVKWFLFLVAPIIMIFFATDAVGHVFRIIRKAFGKVDEKEKDDEDVYYY
ncbi:hypothetical protein ACQYAD_08560 [Neobacillus sp. SM06]|uniref:hypothetical protein n=1 Tax=Neobacillus sp. SM06 TaxID=3422492 RepID=UPI003D2BA338